MRSGRKFYGFMLLLGEKIAHSRKTVPETNGRNVVSPFMFIKKGRKRDNKGSDVKSTQGRVTYKRITLFGV